MDKLKITRVSNDDRFNLMEIENSKVFLDNLPGFVFDAGIVKLEDLNQVFEDNDYDSNLFYFLFYEDHEDEYKTKRIPIKSILNSNKLLRYNTKDFELLIEFLNEKIRLIFYCDEDHRETINTALMKFCEVVKVKKK
ncbi:MAG: hypothetical protein KAQ83_02940 [Nanoarchaeota archaeon]|nr:hypothetical protein [Nanoarchaeota archaeon]